MLVQSQNGVLFGADLEGVKRKTSTVSYWQVISAKPAMDEIQGLEIIAPLFTSLDFVKFGHIDSNFMINSIIDSGFIKWYGKIFLNSLPWRCRDLTESLPLHLQDEITIEDIRDIKHRKCT